MAADTALQVVVSPLLGVLFDNLSFLIHKEIGLIWGADEELKKLANTLFTIQKVLEDAEEEKQLTDKAVANWLLRLKDMAYDADDILDEWEMEAMELLSGEHHASLSKQVCGSIFSCFHSKMLAFRRKIAKRVNELEKKFDEIASEKSRFQLREGVVERIIGLYKNQETSSGLSQQVYGRDAEKAYIIGQLLDGAKGQQVLTICPIVGIGGLGKTTIAQLCFNDKRVDDHFDVKIWVCVSDDFDVKRLMKEAIVSLSREACSIEQLDTLQHLLKEKLANKRFLLVLDDVWNDNQETWNIFSDSFRCGGTGSSIIVTTRLRTVASITKTCPPCFLEPMSAEDCWKLFRQRAFDVGEEESPTLVKIGKEIVEKCRGVPLAAKVLGSLMRFEREESGWLLVKDSEIWSLPQSDKNTILPSLRLSYTHLSPELRQCFAYCAMFPKDYKMGKEDLIHLWMANNLIQAEEGRRMEDTGNRIFKELSLRSFFQDEEKDSDGVVVSCTMHDLVYDLACSINKNECRHLDEFEAITSVPRGIRHLSLSGLYTSSGMQSLNQSSAKLRTFLFKGCYYDYDLFTYMNMPCLSSLRALCFNRLGRLPDSVSKLKHLRYLNLSGSFFQFLPESLCGLRNLRTLNLEDCGDLLLLPKGTRKMGCLRHLNLKKFSRLREMPMQIGKMTYLQTLSIFTVGSTDGQRIKELQGLDNICGEIQIRGLEHVETQVDAGLVRKQKLLSLALVWSNSDDVEHYNERDVAEGLRPHSNLKKLRIKNYQGLAFPSWFDVSFVPNLVEINLKYCKKCEYLPSSLGKLQLLRHLTIWFMTSLKFFFTNGNDMAEQFSSLEFLKLHDIPEMEDWFSGTSGSSEEVILFPRLKELRIIRCFKLERLPPSLLSLLETLEVCQCDRLIFGPSKILLRLSDLTITDCPAVQTLPEVGIASLTSLWIGCCPNITDVSSILRNQTSLVGFTILSCPKAEISKVEYQRLNSLRQLMIKGYYDMTSLPDGLQHLSSTLQELCVSNCPELTSLPIWIESFTGLKRLLLNSCGNLRSLPDGLQHLTGLQSLYIGHCHPELHERCEKNRGEDWPKIAHIPTCEIHLVDERDDCYIPWAGGFVQLRGST